ncbi:MAG: fibronectin type III domain-containing protein, partial [Candidatus Omnitrophota bacterium]
QTAVQATTQALPLPSAPAYLTATVASSSQINLSWPTINLATNGYRIDRSLNGISGWTSIATPTQGSTSYPNTGLSAGTTYFYRIYSVNTTGTSTTYATANATTPTPPAAPGKLTGRALNRSTVYLTWQDNSTNEDGFKIMYYNNGVWTLITTIGKHTGTGAWSCSITATPGTSRYYTVVATNTAGDAYASAPPYVYVTTPL